MTLDPRDASGLMSLAVHEFRTPASVISGYLRMLLRDAEHPLTERQRKMVEEAERSCVRLSGIVAELSDVAKLDRGELKLARQPFDLFTLLEEVASGVHEAEDRGVRLELRGIGTGAPIVGDKTRLNAAFGAIFRAILREQPTEATIVADRRLARTADQNSAVVVVAHIDSVQSSYEAQPGVFDDRRGGLGLALPLARRVIEGQGGRIWAPEGTDGRGAALVSLPIVAAAGTCVGPMEYQR